MDKNTMQIGSNKFNTPMDSSIFMTQEARLQLSKWAEELEANNRIVPIKDSLFKKMGMTVLNFLSY